MGPSNTSSLYCIFSKGIPPLKSSEIEGKRCHFRECIEHYSFQEGKGSAENSHPEKKEYAYGYVSLILHYGEIIFRGKDEVEYSRSVKGRYGKKIENRKADVYGSGKEEECVRNGCHRSAASDCPELCSVRKKTEDEGNDTLSTAMDIFGSLLKK